jgi:hypothetical protein
MPMKPVRPDMKQPRTNAPVRNSPDFTYDSARWLGTLFRPSVFTFVDVRNTITASGTRITRIVLNCRRRYAIAPSWIAWAISFIFSVPSSWASTPLIKKNPTVRASSAVATEPSRIAHSPPWR